MAAASREPASLPCWKSTSSCCGTAARLLLSGLTPGRVFLWNLPSAAAAPFSSTVCCHHTRHRQLSCCRRLCTLLQTCLLPHIRFLPSCFHLPNLLSSSAFSPRTPLSPTSESTSKQKAIQHITRAETELNCSAKMLHHFFPKFAHKIHSSL